jgi:hypothetical protein
MKIYYVLKKVPLLLPVALFAILIIIFPETSRLGVMQGILLCGRVIIPSLFPFTMCVLFIINSNVLDSLNFLSPITKKIFSLNFFEFSLFLLSLVGGYPIGAKLIDHAVSNKKITQQKAKNMLCYCVNAGPAFIISAVGLNVFYSRAIGIVLFISHLLSSLVICSIFRNKDYIDDTKNLKTIPFSENFVLSTAKAAETLISISSFVILFSAINSLLLYFSKQLHFLKHIALVLEITNSLSLNRNIFTISFLLGFGGICIWFQVFANIKQFKINYLKFAFFRILHGFSSMIFTCIFIKIFKITIPTLSQIVSVKPLYSTPALTVSLIIMAVVFALSLNIKNIPHKALTLFEK